MAECFRESNCCSDFLSCKILLVVLAIVLDILTYLLNEWLNELFHYFHFLYCTFSLTRAALSSYSSEVLHKCSEWINVLTYILLTEPLYGSDSYRLQLSTLLMNLCHHAASSVCLSKHCQCFNFLYYVIVLKIFLWRGWIVVFIHIFRC